MPQIFKALATITAWFLFIWGLLAWLFCTIGFIGAGGPFSGTPPSWHAYAGWGVSIISLAMSVVCMKLRQMLE